MEFNPEFFVLLKELEKPLMVVILSVSESATADHTLKFTTIVQNGGRFRFSPVLEMLRRVYPRMFLSRAQHDTYIIILQSPLILDYYEIRQYSISDFAAGACRLLSS